MSLGYGDYLVSAAILLYLLSTLSHHKLSRVSERELKKRMKNLS